MRLGILASANAASLPYQLACLAKRAAQQEFNLGIQAAQLSIGPTLQGFVRCGIKPQKECFPLLHASPECARS
jgi:hypothetical protein